MSVASFSSVGFTVVGQECVSDMNDKVDEGLAKRIVHKIQGKHHKHGDDLEDVKPDKPLHDTPDPHPRHPAVEGCVEIAFMTSITPKTYFTHTRGGLIISVHPVSNFVVSFLDLLSLKLRVSKYRVCESRYVESGIHAAFTEVLDSLNQPEVLASLSKLVKAQAIVGVEAAINEGTLLTCHYYAKHSRASHVMAIIQNREHKIIFQWAVTYSLDASSGFLARHLYAKVIQQNGSTER